jgi:hypothetical protein
MFVQVMEGKVADASVLERQTDSWMLDLAPGATGYLGSTHGITSDGIGLSIVRFEDEASARANSDRPEQGAWWQVTASAYDGDVSFAEATDVETVLFGDPDEAGFVQVIRGRVNDQGAFRAMIVGSADQLHEARPDILGVTLALHGGGELTQVVYFASEDQTRKLESETEGEDGQQEFLAQFAEPPAFYDLADPALY